MIYINFDLETTGWAPDRHAILSIGAVAHEDQHWSQVGEFSMNLAVPENRSWDPDTKAWWETEENRIAFEATTKNPWRPGWVIQSFFEWIRHLQGGGWVQGVDEMRVAFVANPIAYDLPFLRSYMKEYVGAPWDIWAKENHAGLGGIDLPTLAMTVLNVPYPDARRRNWPERWSPQNLPHTHVAIDDARHQAHAFVQMMAELSNIRIKGML